MLSSLAIEHLRSQYTEQNVPVLCTYLNYKEQDIQSPRNLIASLLKQLVEFRNYAYCSDDLLDSYREKARGASLSTKELQKAFCSEISHYDR